MELVLLLLLEDCLVELQPHHNQLLVVDCLVEPQVRRVECLGSRISLCLAPVASVEQQLLPLLRHLADLAARQAKLVDYLGPSQLDLVSQLQQQQPQLLVGLVQTLAKLGDFLVLLPSHLGQWLLSHNNLVDYLAPVLARLQDLAPPPTQLLGLVGSVPQPPSLIRA